MRDADFRTLWAGMTVSRLGSSVAALFGRVLAGMQFVDFGAIPVGAVLGGALAGPLGTRGAIMVMALGYAASGLILVLGPLRGRRDLPTTAATA